MSCIRCSLTARRHNITAAGCHSCDQAEFHNPGDLVSFAGSVQLREITTSATSLIQFVAAVHTRNSYTQHSRFTGSSHATKQMWVWAGPVWKHAYILGWLDLYDGACLLFKCIACRRMLAHS